MPFLCFRLVAGPLTVILFLFLFSVWKTGEDDELSDDSTPMISMDVNGPAGMAPQAQQQQQMHQNAQMMHMSSGGGGGGGSGDDSKKKRESQRRPVFSPSVFYIVVSIGSALIISSEKSWASLLLV